MAFRTTHPTTFRQNNCHWLRWNKVVLAHGFRFFTLLQRRTTIVAIRLCISLNFFLNQRIQLTFRSQQCL